MTSPLSLSQNATAHNASLRFIAVDVETANSQHGSICQIGLALAASDGTITTKGLLIDPEQPFSSFNINLHGIGPKTVSGAATFPEALERLRPLLEQNILIQHSSFDKKAFDAACARYGIAPLASQWLDSVQIARKAWPELKGNGGHGLASLKSYLGLVLKHHDAEEDARAAAEVTLLAETATGSAFTELAAPRKKAPRFEASLAIAGNPNGPFYGEIACFSGTLAVSRVEAAKSAAGVGITVKTSLTQKTTLLIVGAQALETDQPQSTKHKRAEEMARAGHSIKIITEHEFHALIQTC